MEADAAAANRAGGKPQWYQERLFISRKDDVCFTLLNALAGASPSTNLAGTYHESRICTRRLQEVEHGRGAWYSGGCRSSVSHSHTKPSSLLNVLQQKAGEALQVPRLMLRS